MITPWMAINATLIMIVSQSISDTAFGSLLSSAKSASVSMDDYSRIYTVDKEFREIASTGIQDHAKSFLKLKRPSKSDRQHFVQMTADSLGETFARIFNDQFKGLTR